MPRITTIAEARELVGRTFERDGERRTFMSIWAGPEFRTPSDFFVSWERHDVPDDDYRYATHRKHLSLWLRGAKEITE